MESEQKQYTHEMLHSLVPLSPFCFSLSIYLSLSSEVQSSYQSPPVVNGIPRQSSDSVSEDDVFATASGSSLSEKEEFNSSHKLPLPEKGGKSKKRKRKGRGRKGSGSDGEMKGKTKGNQEANNVSCVCVCVSTHCCYYCKVNSKY